jgi:hypothetical protein
MRAATAGGQLSFARAPTGTGPTDTDWPLFPLFTRVLPVPATSGAHWIRPTSNWSYWRALFDGPVPGMPYSFKLFPQDAFARRSSERSRRARQ